MYQHVHRVSIIAHCVVWSFASWAAGKFWAMVSPGYENWILGKILKLVWKVEWLLNQDPRQAVVFPGGHMEIVKSPQLSATVPPANTRVTDKKPFYCSFFFHISSLKYLALESLLLEMCHLGTPWIWQVDDEKPGRRSLGGTACPILVAVVLYFWTYKLVLDVTNTPFKLWVVQCL